MQTKMKRLISRQIQSEELSFFETVSKHGLDWFGVLCNETLQQVHMSKQWCAAIANSKPHLKPKTVMDNCGAHNTTRRFSIRKVNLTSPYF